MCRLRRDSRRHNGAVFPRAPQDGTANAEGYGNITQGSLEQANVDVVSEMSDMIAAQRAYEMNAKVIGAADQMLQTTSALFR